MSARGRILLGLAIAVIVLLPVVPAVATRIAVPMFNPTPQPLPDAPSDEAARLHETLEVSDLHADALLWDKPLLRRGSTGHVDVPRLVEGRIALQVFTTVTKAPTDMNIEANSADTDQVTLVTVLQGWPPRTWTSLLQRSLYQADKLHHAADRSEGRLSVVTSRSELDAYLDRRSADQTIVAGVLGIEGAHALEGDVSNVDRVFEAGFRMIGLTHFFDNEVGGSAHGIQKGGLTDVGRAVIARMEELGIAIDLAHASLPLIDDVLELASTPVFVSHTGVRGTCDNRRNLDDERLRRIASTGGVVGIGLWPTALCGELPSDWARAVRHAVNVAGIDHVGLGSDWDGAVPTIIDASGTAHLTDALLRDGFSEREIRQIMGANVLRVLGETLPD